MQDLPECRHRFGQIESDRWICGSPNVEVLGGIVTGEICRDLCPHVDHAPASRAHEGLPVVPERFTGSQRGKPDDEGTARPALEPIVVEADPAILSIAMITAPRPVSTVERSVYELRRAGFEQTIHLFAEPGSPRVADETVVTQINRTRRGSWPNWRAAATAMLEKCDSPFILMCEDDIMLSRCAALGLQAAVNLFPHSDWGFASLYAPRRDLQDQVRRTGWIAVTKPALWGALAWCFTRESLRAVLQSPAVIDHPGDRDTDLVVSSAIDALGRRTYFHLPSLAGHTGAGISSLGHAPLEESVAIGFDPQLTTYVPAGGAGLEVASPGASASQAKVRVLGDHSITVVVPTYNCRAYLAGCLESLRSQTVRCEIVVVDDASTDGSLQTLRTYEPDIQVIAHDQNRGANPARLSGIHRTRSTWVVMADADAVYSPRYLESMLAHTDSTTTVAYCGMRRTVSDTGKSIVFPGRDFDPQALWWSNYISMCSLVRRRALPLEWMARTDLLEDWHLWLQLAATGHRFVPVNAVLFEAQIRADGKSALIESNCHRQAVEVANVRRPYASLIGCDTPLSVVIPAKDCGDLTSECLWHLARYTGLPFQVVYVDNGSSRRTLAQVQEAADLLHLKLDVVRNHSNQGFTRAVNQGIGRSPGRHVLCLNNDCFVGPQCVDRMFAELTSPEARVAAVGPLTGDDSRHSLRQGWLRSAAGVPADRAFDYEDALAGFQVLHRRRLGRRDRLLAFFCTLLHRHALTDCGPLDETTQEFRSGLGADDEWCFRVAAAGWQLRMALDAYAVHLGNRTFRRLGIDRRELQRKALDRLKTMDRDETTR